MFVILTLAAALAYAQASTLPQSYPGPSYPGPSYPGPGYGYGAPRDYYPDIAEARSRIYALSENDVILNNRLDGVQVKIDLVSAFREIFESETLPEIKASMEAQDERIKSITEELKNLMVLFDEVEALQTQVNNLVTDLQEVRATRVEAEGDLSRLENADIDQERDIAEIQAQVDYQDKRLDEADKKVTENEAFVERVYEATIKIVNIINDERAEPCIEVVLDPYNPVQYVEYSKPFPEVPGLSWGITEFSAIEGDKKYEESIYAHVDVKSDQYGANITLIDQSETWYVERVVIKFTAFYVNNDICEIH